MKTIKSKINLNNINAEKLTDELEVLAELLTEKLNGPWHTTISYIRENPVLPEFLIEAMNAYNPIPSILAPVCFESKKPDHTKFHNFQLEFVEENNLTRSLENLATLIDYIGEDSEIAKIAISYYDAISLSTENQSFQNSCVTATCKSEDNKISEYRFKKVELEFKNAITPLITD